MKLTYKQIVTTYNSLSELSEMPMKYSSALRISRNISEFERHVVEFEEERRRLFDKYLETDDSGMYIPVLDEQGQPTGAYRIKQDCSNDFKTDIATLESFEVDVTIYNLTPEDFEDVKLTPKQMIGLASIIDDE